MNVLKRSFNVKYTSINIQFKYLTRNVKKMRVCVENHTVNIQNKLVSKSNKRIFAIIRQVNTGVWMKMVLTVTIHLVRSIFTVLNVVAAFRYIYAAIIVTSHLVLTTLYKKNIRSLCINCVSIGYMFGVFRVNCKLSSQNITNELKRPAKAIEPRHLCGWNICKNLIISKYKQILYNRGNFFEPIFKFI